MTDDSWYTYFRFQESLNSGARVSTGRWKEERKKYIIFIYYSKRSLKDILVFVCAFRKASVG
jgi:hypothetical protein